jgi:hypothetical protein
MKRRELIPKLCSRCGNDLMTGSTILHLPFEKRYIVFCTVCHIGLKLSNELHQSRIPTIEEWEEFWNEEIYGTKITKKNKKV